MSEENKKDNKFKWLEDAGFVQSGYYKNVDEKGKVVKPSILKMNRELITASWKVLMLDKEILLFPISSLLINLPFIYLLLSASEKSNLFMLVLILYFFVSVISIFFNTGVVAATAIRLKGGDPKFTDGLKIAVRRIDKIFAWAFYSCTIGLVIALFSRISRLFSIAGEISWTLITCFVIPIIVFENKNVSDSIRDSKQLIRKYWGVSITGVFSILFITGFVFTLLLFIFIGVAMSGQQDLARVIFFIGIIVLVFSIILNSALQYVYNTALYVYATHSKEILYFNHNTLKDSIRKK